MTNRNFVCRVVEILRKLKGFDVNNFDFILLFFKRVSHFRFWNIYSKVCLGREKLIETGSLRCPNIYFKHLSFKMRKYLLWQRINFNFVRKSIFSPFFENERPYLSHSDLSLNANTLLHCFMGYVWHRILKICPKR